MRPTNNNRVIVGSALVIFILFICWPFILYFFIDSPGIVSEERGHFGDMYGALTSLFSGATLVFLVYTIYQQNNMIEQQRADYKIAVTALENQERQLKLNLKELNDTRKEFKQQNRTLRYQRFETSFFNLVSLYKLTADFFDQKNNVGDFRGESKFEAFERGVAQETGLGEYAIVSDSYIRKYLSHVKRHYSKYLMSFEVVYDFIVIRKTKLASRNRYFKIFVSQFSFQEKVFLYYHFALLPSDQRPLHWAEFAKLAFKDMKSEHFAYWPLVASIEKEVRFFTDPEV